MGHVMEGLFRPAGMALMSKNELAIADKKTVKIYRYGSSQAQGTNIM